MRPLCYETEYKKVLAEYRNGYHALEWVRKKDPDSNFFIETANLSGGKIQLAFSNRNIYLATGMGLQELYDSEKEIKEKIQLTHLENIARIRAEP